jgi:hypothetical protein
MTCNASYARLFLDGFLYARQFDMQPICTPMLAKFYSCKKWVLQHPNYLKAIHSDIGTEFSNASFDQFDLEHGIDQQFLPRVFLNRIESWNERTTL